jgi:tRNA(Ile)-lysidine synthetase-like protein
MNTIEKQELFADGGGAVMGVSGGPDSMCLLELMVRLRDRLDLELIVAHVDHGLSENSEAIANEVARYAAAEGIDVHVVRAQGLEGPNLQARARDFRYLFFESLAEKEDARYVVTAHTQDDRVETTLARLIHGGGTRTLAGILPRDGIRVRPLIDCRRAETRAYCDERGIPYHDDPSNEDLRFERVAVRSIVLSAIEGHWGPGAIDALVRSAERLAEDADALDELTERFARDLIEPSPDGARVRRDLLATLPRAMRRRVLEAAMGRVRDRGPVIDAVLDALDKDATEVRFSGPEGIELKLDKETVTVVQPTA